eukprot:scaffold15967_cov55-Phaeocystis_antarctica.AAC.3
MMTPSGLSMGTTRKSSWRRSASASAEGPVRKSRMPCIMNDALLSPGWTRAEMATTRRASMSLCAAV